VLFFVGCAGRSTVLLLGARLHLISNSKWGGCQYCSVKRLLGWRCVIIASNLH